MQPRSGGENWKTSHYSEHAGQVELAAGNAAAISKLSTLRLSETDNDH
jgi:hypothetical protein